VLSAAIVSVMPPFVDLEEDIAHISQLLWMYFRLHGYRHAWCEYSKISETSLLSFRD
jgi:hypothetical protein